ncbi:hypothetical protein [Candidatus Regiella endosymbiont of Tuberolachnus salignus]|uniref:hypothetical protein n=1 Tax=Candidatus Regiella endosymbiont of Tuberolachnus salignus TaxID=3077956 RepID=UPI0030CB5ED1
MNMTLSLGAGYFPVTTISNDRVKKILNDRRRPHMTLWEKIKEFFFSNGQEEALQCLHQLCHPSNNTTLDEVENILFRLKELAAPKYKEMFHYNADSNDNFFQIKDNNGNRVFSISKNDKTFSYTILDKKFSFNDPTMKFNSPDNGDFRSHPVWSDGLSIVFTKSPININDMKLSVAYKGNSLPLDVSKIYKDIMKIINEANTVEFYNQWLKQERNTYICAIINRQIDNAVNQQLNKSIDLQREATLYKFSPKERLYLFEKTMNYLNINKSDITIDTACAQSSINHVVLTYLSKNTMVSGFLNRENDRNKKNKINTRIACALSDLIYESIYNKNISSVRKTAYHVASSYILMKARSSLVAANNSI